MRLAIVSSRFPKGRGEPYLGVELEALRPHLSYLTVEPVRPPLSLRTVALAAATCVSAPVRCIRALFEVLRGSGSPTVRLKNLTAFPRALALAWEFRRQGIEHVHAYWLSVPATAALVISRVNGIPFSSTAHRWDITERNMIAEKARRASFVRVVSEYGRAELARAVPHCAEKFSVVRLGTALDEAGQGARSERNDTLTLLCAAAFVPVKGHRDLLSAFERAHRVNPELELTLCGTGTLEDEIREYAENLTCSSAIHFAGYVERRTLLEQLRRGTYDAVILASRDDGREHEGVPSILIEAASLGVACIATRSGSITELLGDDSAFLAPPHQPHLLAQAILAARNPIERRRRAARARERAVQLHDPAHSAAQLISLLGILA